MAFKIVVALAFVAVASAGFIPAQQFYQAQAEAQPQAYYSAPVQHIVPVTHHDTVLAKQVEEFDHHPQYKYSYSVDDRITGDSKYHSEERNGDVVHGEYSLIDPDGYRRIVTYTADARNGFNAVVRREPLVKAIHAVPVAPYYDSAPQLSHYSPSGYYHHP